MIWVAVSCGIAALAVLGMIIYRSIWYPVAKKPIPGRFVIACIGDSITFGAGVKNRARNSYPAILQKELGTRVQAINYGMNGRTLLSTGDRPYVLEKNYRRTFSDHPDLCIIMLGTNDAKPDNWNEAAYETELTDFLNRYVALCGASRVFVMQPPKVFPIADGKPVAFGISEENMQSVCRVIDRVAKALSVNVIDLYALTETHPDWFADGVHPNEKGNQLIARHIAERIQRSVPEKENL